MGGYISNPPRVVTVEVDKPCRKKHADEIIKYRDIELLLDGTGHWRFRYNGRTYKPFDSQAHAEDHVDWLLDKSKGKDKAHQALRYHPNFKLPELPETTTVTDVAAYIIESLARFVSPQPKLKDENEEFACEDIAAAIRERVGPELLEMVKQIEPKYLLRSSRPRRFRED
jgi:hypothetical protein